MRIPQTIVPWLCLLATACISLPDIEADGGIPPDAGYDGGALPDGGLDQTPPTVVRTTPPNSATRVPLDSTVEIDFSEEMTASTLRLSSTPPVSFGLTSWTPETRQAVFSASPQFAQDTQYTISVEGKDLAGNSLAGTPNFAFTTVGPAPDTTPPTLADSSPPDSAIGVPREGTLKLTFSEPMNKASVERAFSIGSSTNSIAGTFTWNSAGTEVLFIPSATFPYGTTVQWGLTTDATDVAGNTLSPTSHSFRVIRLSTVTLSPALDNEMLIYNFTTTSGADPWPIGDDTKNKAYRAGASYLLTDLNSQLTRITEATLTWPYLSSCHDPSCSPFSVLGAFIIESIYYGDSFDPQTVWYAPRIGSPLLLASESALNVDLYGYCSVSVLNMVVDAWSNRSTRSMRAQFRLSFETLTNNDNQADKLDISAPDLKLTVKYEIP